MFVLCCQHLKRNIHSIFILRIDRVPKHPVLIDAVRHVFGVGSTAANSDFVANPSSRKLFERYQISTAVFH